MSYVDPDQLAVPTTVALPQPSHVTTILHARASHDKTSGMAPIKLEFVCSDITEQRNEQVGNSTAPVCGSHTTDSPDRAFANSAVGDGTGAISSQQSAFNAAAAAASSSHDSMPTSPATTEQVHLESDGKAESGAESVAFSSYDEPASPAATEPPLLESDVEFEPESVAEPEAESAASLDYDHTPAGPAAAEDACEAESGTASEAESAAFPAATEQLHPESDAEAKSGSETRSAASSEYDTMPASPAATEVLHPDSDADSAQPSRCSGGAQHGKAHSEGSDTEPVAAQLPRPEPNDGHDTAKSAAKHEP